MLRFADEAYELHVSLIRHGRRTCTARNPGLPRVPAAVAVPVRQRAGDRRMTICYNLA